MLKIYSKNIWLGFLLRLAVAIHHYLSYLSRGSDEANRKKKGKMKKKKKKKRREEKTPTRGQEVGGRGK